MKDFPALARSSIRMWSFSAAICCMITSMSSQEGLSKKCKKKPTQEFSRLEAETPISASPTEVVFTAVSMSDLAAEALVAVAQSHRSRVSKTRKPTRRTVHRNCMMWYRVRYVVRWSAISHCMDFVTHLQRVQKQRPIMDSLFTRTPSVLEFF